MNIGLLIAIAATTAFLVYQLNRKAIELATARHERDELQTEIENLQGRERQLMTALLLQKDIVETSDSRQMYRNCVKLAGHYLEHPTRFPG